MVSNYGTSSSAGRLEVYYSGQWGTVCDDGFGANEARAACRHLGYTTYSRYGRATSLGYKVFTLAQCHVFVGHCFSRYSSASSSTPIWLDDVSCSSTATSLNQCTSRAHGFHDCIHSEDVAISCTGKQHTVMSLWNESTDCFFIVHYPKL